jgi:hypothetical protein
MGIRVLELHHHAVRIDSEQPKLEAVQQFYTNVLGLSMPIQDARLFPVPPVFGSMSAKAGKSI